MSTANGNLGRDSAEWHYARDGEQHGPVSRTMLQDLIQKGLVQPTDLVWTSGMWQWQAAKDVGLCPPPPLPAVSAASPPSATLQTPMFEPNKPRVQASATPSAMSQGQPNYLVRHWRGDLPLAVSYWLNGFLATIAVLAVSLGVGSVEVQPHPVLYSVLAMALLLVVVPAVITWQIVGIWRSAGKHVSRGGRSVWATLAQVVVVLSVLRFAMDFATTSVPAAMEYGRIAFGQDKWGTYTVRVLRDATELEVSGPIGFGLTDRVRQELDSHPTINLVHLNSSGGRIAEARALQKLIEQRGLNTYTSTGCASACILVYAAGKERLISATGKLGFHQYSFPGMSNSDFAGEYAEDKAYLRSRGIDSAFLDRGYSTKNDDMWMPTHAELLKAHVITGRAGDDQVALSGSSLKELEDIEGQLVKTLPLFATLKESDPELFKETTAYLKDALLKGRTMSELRGQLAPRLIKLREQRLPYASDEAVTTFVRTVVEELGALKQVDPRLCYGYAMGDDPAIAGKAYEALPANLRDREMRALALVISTGKREEGRPPPKAEGEAALEEVLNRMGKKHSQRTLDALSQLSTPGIDPALGCAAVIALYSEVLLLPPQKAAMVMRHMLNS